VGLCLHLQPLQQSALWCCVIWALRTLAFLYYCDEIHEGQSILFITTSRVVVVPASLEILQPAFAVNENSRLAKISAVTSARPQITLSSSAV
jgi:hypothetical protein